MPMAALASQPGAAVPGSRLPAERDEQRAHQRAPSTTQP